MKGILFRATESAVGIASGLVLFGGVATAQSIDTTGPDSTNIISISDKLTCKVTNDNDVKVVNNNPQTAVSGDSETDKNTTVGSVNSGNASNDSSAEFVVDVSNGSAGCLTAQQTNPVTPVTPTTPVAVQEAAPSVQTGGGRGGESPQVTPAAQVVVPTGGVGAGSGGLASLGGLVAITLASGGLALARIPFARIQQQLKEQP